MKAPKLKNQIGERSETGRSKAVSIGSLELMGRLYACTIYKSLPTKEAVTIGHL